MQRIFPLIIFFQLWLAVWCLPASAAYPVSFTDSEGRNVLINSRPGKVVSLLPAATEMILELGAADVLNGITAAPLLSPTAADIRLVGGFLSFYPDLVAASTPEVIFHSTGQEKIIENPGGGVTLVNLEPASIAESFIHLRLLGEIFDRQQKAEALIKREKHKLELIRKKIDKLAAPKKRVIRISGDSRLRIPENPALDNDFIRSAGGLPPSFYRELEDGELVSLEKWQEFDPQVIYGCRDEKKLRAILKKPGWREVEAVRNNRIYFFNCGLADRAATHSGDFVSLLASRIYTKEFSDSANYVLPEKVVGTRPVELDLDWIDRAEVLESDIHDFRNKTLLLRLARPMAVVSTLAGQRTQVTAVANHYFPPPSWGLGHQKGLAGLRDHTRQVLDLDREHSALLFTGADMDNLAVINRRFRDLSVYALVTAGVRGNAVRMAEDVGRFYKPGTINILILSNRRLSPRAMTRAIISATEAKTAALADLDIRSSYTPLLNQATGTGTDNIIVLQGEGAGIEASGGHTRMGEYIARAVYEGVQQAVRRQNGLVQSRHVLYRLRERNISLTAAAGDIMPQSDRNKLGRSLERLLMDEEYAGFMQASLAISDAYEKGLPVNLPSFDLWSRSLATEIAGREIALPDQPGPEGLPLIIWKSFTALLHGLEAGRKE